MFTTFRSRDTIEAIYFDGSRESALEILNAFPHSVQLELDGENKPMLRITSQAHIVKEHSWLYKNGEHGRIEVRDHGELTKKWEQLGEGATAQPPKNRPRARKQK